MNIVRQNLLIRRQPELIGHQNPGGLRRLSGQSFLSDLTSGRCCSLDPKQGWSPGTLIHILGHEEVDKMAAEMFSVQQPLGSQGASAGRVPSAQHIHRERICSVYVSSSAFLDASYCTAEPASMDSVHRWPPVLLSASAGDLEGACLEGGAPLGPVRALNQ